MKKIFFIFFLMLFSYVLFSAPSVAEIRSLKITADEQWFFTDSKCSFSLKIPDVLPNRVQITIGSMPEYLRFISSYKEEFVENGIRGTFIHLWFSSAKSGSIKIPALSLKINGRSYKIPFEAVMFYENPELIRPELIIDFFDSAEKKLKVDSKGNIIVKTGEPIKIKLSLKYAAQISAFGWDLPENALFSEIHRYPLTEGNVGQLGFSPNSEPVADFSWTPLEPGSYDLPPIKITAVSYNGLRVDLALPSWKLLATGSVTIKNNKSEMPSMLKDAFQKAKEESSSKEEILNVENLALASEIAKLRSQERYSFPFSDVSKQRKILESEHGFVDTASEKSVLLLMFCIAAFCCCVIFVILLLLRKHFYWSVVLALLGIMFLTCGVLYGAALSRCHGVFVGGEVRLVPELSSKGSVSISSCSYVQIIEKTDGWCYIETSGAGGWVPSESVIEITKKNRE